VSATDKILNYRFVLPLYALLDDDEDELRRLKYEIKRAATEFGLGAMRADADHIGRPWVTVNFTFEARLT
jgi:hypothetical protein